MHAEFIVGENFGGPEDGVKTQVIYIFHATEALVN
jgi:hypothetical protein